jgi:hypothetical protein
LLDESTLVVTFGAQLFGGFSSGGQVRVGFAQLAFLVVDLLSQKVHGLLQLLVPGRQVRKATGIRHGDFGAWRHVRRS